MRFSATVLLGLVPAALATPMAARQDDDTIVIAPTPDSFTTCIDYTFTWEGGVAPYTVGVYKSDGGLYLQTYQNETSVTWNVDAAGGKEINLQLYDSDGSGTWTGNIPVVNGTDVTCVKCAGYFGYQYC